MSLSGFSRRAATVLAACAAALTLLCHASPAQAAGLVTPAPTSVPTPSPTIPSGLDLGLGLGFDTDPGHALRAPAPGSQPSAAPTTTPRPPAAPAEPASVAEQRTDRWEFLSGPAAGEWLFLSGFLVLLLSIGGLVTVGIYRRRW